ncbi:unnamed protein product [Linum tenue]|uniref:Reverse transcriptase zinc-binding domain-containing protein n=1 Tax=Linum tenue TaxID=586396 RepID=A0AAV0S3G6_9ROSI|nr:unnamed protein product [Linum tenue]
MGGRVVLNKTVLSSQPVYLFSLLKAPKTVINRMEGIQRRFIWSGNSDSAKAPLVSWERCKAPRSQGGLGITDLASFNEAMLSKWHWRYANESNRWWKTLISHKYPNTHSLWYPNRCNNGFANSAWANISKVHDQFWNSTCIDPGSGAWCSFWHDVWIPNTCLAANFPRVAAAASDPEARISDVRNGNVEGNHWDFHLNIMLRGGAERELCSLIDFLDRHATNRVSSGPSRPVWLPDPDNAFSVHSMYRTLVKNKFQGDPNFPAKSIWKHVIPSKICIFLWLTTLKRIQTLDNLKRKGWSIANRCALCEKEEESVDHLFIKCDYGKEVWYKCRMACPSIANTSEDIFSTVRDWKSSTPNNINEWINFCALHAITWQLWLERNRRIFQEASQNPTTVARKAFNLMIEWPTAMGKITKEEGQKWLHDQSTRAHLNAP